MHAQKGSDSCVISAGKSRAMNRSPFFIYHLGLPL